MDSLEMRLERVGAGPAPTLEEMHAIAGLAPSEDWWRPRMRPDASRPYGRNVFLNTEVAEGMLATWTRRHPCAPHDHGGSFGVVRVLQGEAIHRVWEVSNGELRLTFEERRGAGQILVCGRDIVHSMADGGAAEPLVTLHLYVDPIQHMVVYDVAARRTFVVDGGCGAWVPLDDPSLIRCSLKGFQRDPQLFAE